MKERETQPKMTVLGREIRAPLGRYPRSLKILLAEDNEVNQMMATAILEKLSHTVELACDGLEAVAKWKLDSFDLILMDLQMPECDGYEATRMIRSLESQTQTGAVPILAFTADSSPQAEELCAEAGMDGFVSKPLTQKKISGELLSLFGAQ